MNEHDEPNDDDNKPGLLPPAPVPAGSRAARYLPPDKVERAARMADFISTPAMPLAEVAMFLDLPYTTIEQLRREGRGPKCFKIGRRIYVLQVDLRQWLDALAKSDAA